MIMPGWGVYFPAVVSHAYNSIKADEASIRQDFGVELGHRHFYDGSSFFYVVDGL